MNDLDQQIRESLQRLDDLWQGAEQLSLQQQRSLVEALKELTKSLDELQVVAEELRQQNEELAASRLVVESEQKRYQELFNFAPDGYLVTDSLAVIIEANQAAASLLNIQQNYLVGKPLSIFVPESVRADFRTQLIQLQNGELVRNWEIQIQPRQKNPFPAGLTVAPVRNPEGKVIGMRWQLKDITTRKQYEAALESDRDTLEHLVEARTTALQAANVQLTQLNTELDCLVQQRTSQLQQALKFEAMLKRISDKVRDSLDESQILQTAVEELGQLLEVSCCDATIYNAEQTQATICYEYTTTLRSAKGLVVEMADFQEHYSQLVQGHYFQFCNLGEYRETSAILTCPIFDDKGEVLGDLCLFKPQDTSFNELEIRLVQQVANQCAIAIRQARLYQATQAQVKELQNLNHLKDDFLNTVSHELRTPITSIKMAIHLLARTLNHDPSLFAQTSNSDAQRSKIERYLQILHNECERESNLINDVLDLQRLEAGRQSLMPTAIQLQDWLIQLVKPFQERTKNRQQRLLLDINSELPSLMCDPDSLGRVMAELLNNACKYTPPGEEIAVTALVEGAMIQLSVRNTGVEIPGSELSRIFDKFYRIPKADPWKQGGTGLGLALVEKLVAHMGGTIQVKSASGQTCFTVAFPV
jgi:PAS domain S-box-containing protein